MTRAVRFPAVVKPLAGEMLLICSGAGAGNLRRARTHRRMRSGAGLPDRVPLEVLQGKRRRDRRRAPVRSCPS